MIFEKWQLLIVTAGEYSDYGIEGLVEVVTPFDPDEVEGIYLVERNKKSQNWKGEDRLVFGTGYLDWLISRGYVAPLKAKGREYWYTGYGEKHPQLERREFSEVGP